MKYAEIDLGSNGKAMISYENIISIETRGNSINIEYPTKSINLVFASIRSTAESDAMRNLAYDKIKKILEKL